MARKVEHFDEEYLMDFDDDEEKEQEHIKFQRAVKRKKYVAENLNQTLYPDAKNDVLEGLDAYIKWHREHPGCSTPRKAR